MEGKEVSGEQYFVDIGQTQVGFAGDLLRITSLGSCIGLILYPDDTNPRKCAVMGHIMLPKSREPDDNKPIKKYRFGPKRFADIAIPSMIKDLENNAGKSRRKNFIAKMIGGAQMFGYTKLTLRIGEENAEMTKKLLKEAKIPLEKEFTGGDTGMSVTFNVSDYLLRVKPTGGKSIIV
ncbi:MAG: chemotaxis protein CheD [Candidatus Hodarchaeales archaeon]|jgi:chemotaxis protein CheD